jgi:hypothetical protein
LKYRDVMARETVASRMGANLKLSYGVAVSPAAMWPAPAAWARTAGTARLGGGGKEKKRAEANE